MAISACGSNNNATSTRASGSSGGSSTSAAKVECGGKPTLKASGSTAQANAMTRFVNAYEQACPGKTLNYTANGSGAGVSEFIGNQTDFGGSDSPLNQQAGEVDKAAQRCGSPAPDLRGVFGPSPVAHNLAGLRVSVLAR